MTELETLGTEYYALLGQQRFVEEELDYTIMKQHLPFLDRLAQVNNSGITVFDLFRKTHLYTSYNFADLFGYDLTAIQEQGNQYFDARIHPEDYVQMLRNGINILHFYYGLPKEERVVYKFVNEYRVLGNDASYIRVIEQHQALGLDKQGNVWLALGVIDISPDQSDFQGIKSQIFNYKTGKVVPIQAARPQEPSLSKREVEILQLVKEGRLSKEISEKLFISVHTVNTHRQRILEKLGANNSLEAITHAARFGLIP